MMASVQWRCEGAAMSTNAKWRIYRKGGEPKVIMYKPRHVVVRVVMGLFAVVKFILRMFWIIMSKDIPVEVKNIVIRSLVIVLLVFTIISGMWVYREVVRIEKYVDTKYEGVKTLIFKLEHTLVEIPEDVIKIVKRVETYLEGVGHGITMGFDFLEHIPRMISADFDDQMCHLLFNLKLSPTDCSISETQPLASASKTSPTPTVRSKLETTPSMRARPVVKEPAKPTPKSQDSNLPQRPNRPASTV